MTKFSTLGCTHFKKCSGCTLSEELFNPPILFFLKENLPPHLELSIFHGHAHDWRIRSKLAIRGTCNEPVIGLFEKGSHRAFDIPLCRVHHPKINEVILLLKKAISTFKIAPYNEEKHEGCIRYLQAFLEKKTQTVQLTLVLNEEAISLDLKLFLQYLADLKEIHSLWVNFQPKVSNTIFGTNFEQISGETFVTNRMLNHDFYFHPACFAQANFELFELLIKNLASKVIPNTSVAEFYAGVGVIGVNLHLIAKEVHLYELNPYSELGFTESAKGLSNIHYHTMSSEEGLMKTSAEVFIVDPPRKGLSKEFKEGLQKNKSCQQLIYVSCGVESFCRDRLHLEEMGFELKEVEAYVMFPGSDHLEILAVFIK